MANNQIRIGAPVNATGGFSSAALGTALPVDANSELAAAFTALGMVGEDGLSETEDRNTDLKRIWGGGVGRVLQTEYGIELTITLMERTTTVLKEIRGQDNVTEADLADGRKLRTVLRNSKMLPRRSYVADILDGDMNLRLVIPDGQITAIGDVQYVHSDTIAYECTIQLFEDENGQYMYEYEAYSLAA